MILRILPALLALLLVLGLESAARDLTAGLARFRALRFAVLASPAEARAEFCASPPPASRCLLNLAPACDARWSPGPRRYYEIRLACRLPPWAGNLPLPLLEVRLFR